MSKEQDGGPAFPSPMQDDRDCYARNKSGYGGLSIRDWFAGQAIVGMAMDTNPEAMIAEFAYDLADAMLKARKQ